MSPVAQGSAPVLALGAGLQTVVCSAVVLPIQQGRQQPLQWVRGVLARQQKQWVLAAVLPMALLVVFVAQRVGVMLSVPALLQPPVVRPMWRLGPLQPLEQDAAVQRESNCDCLKPKHGGGSGLSRP